MLSLNLFGLLTYALVVLAQNAAPTNSSIPDTILQQSQLALSYGPINGGVSVPIAYALDFTYNTLDLANTTRARNLFLNGTVQIVNPSSISNLTNTSIAYISCDTSSYNQSNANIQQTISLAKEQMSPGNNQTGAIILYTSMGQWCNYSAPTDFNYAPVFVLPSPSKAMSTFWALSERPLAGVIANTQVRNSNGQPYNPGSGNDQVSGNSGSGMPQTPSTTVAMIILYSVTGIITLCFIVVIVTGALRARRHPERYGLVNLPGNAHQRRAKGIARAMLETIPIIKFGEKEPIKMPADAERGMELQTTALPTGTARQNNTSTNEVPETAPSGNPLALNEAGSSRAASSSAPAVSPAQQSDKPWDVIPDDGLACSVCTEDFIKGQDLRVLPCNHKFHPECIDPWLLNVSGTCPLCRIDLRPPEDRDEAPEQLLNPEVSQAAPATSTDPYSRTGSVSVPAQGARHSVFLSRHRMREATPMQRLRALRDFRNHRRVGNTAVAGGTNTEANISTTPSESVSRSNRVSRLFGRHENNHSASTGTASNAPDASNTTTNTT